MLWAHCLGLLTKLPLFLPSSSFFSKAIETGIILLVDQVIAIIFVKKQKDLILAHLKDFYQFTKPCHEFELLLMSEPDKIIPFSIALLFSGMSSTSDNFSILEASLSSSLLKPPIMKILLLTRHIVWANLGMEGWTSNWAQDSSPDFFPKEHRKKLSLIFLLDMDLKCRPPCMRIQSGVRANIAWYLKPRITTLLEHSITK